MINKAGGISRRLFDANKGGCQGEGWSSPPWNFTISCRVEL
jgi:hypothetical protein